MNTGGVSPISHNALDRTIYTIFPPFFSVIQSWCYQASKGQNNNDLFDLYLIRDLAVCCVIF